jgi:hypothetical protein
MIFEIFPTTLSICLIFPIPVPLPEACPDDELDDCASAFELSGRIVVAIAVVAKTIAIPTVIAKILLRPLLILIFMLLKSQYMLTNTPMLEVVRRSPQVDKKFYIVDVFPRQQKELPTNMIEVWHRARDIVFMDKTDNNIEMLKATEKYLSLIKTIYDMLHDDTAKVDQITNDKLKKWNCNTIH